ncbi:hypothetical protein L226DRAFT_525611 [Lentinus tigrinus ALCF2SS1-7]|uniref:DUF6533 domain-containing protein n=1 Tax=Lentinus tigrinus ALCF2SS1-6 TaxID=1328759 RepID=A0A5C2SG56_9APHY|nr:hypothetical protein L227DRAFT_563583 [Lentinus tigrinus ALCF2SS1-6]RPD70870.1 hypothetical protein L226DRAFT_525611 [Lentinus tigrinus ALCF2SS1-7]
MSSNDDIASEDLTFLISNYFANAGSSLVVYEYMITLGREVELFWRGRLTGAAILFFFNRYLSLVVDVYGLLENMHVPDKICPNVARSSKALDILQYFPWAVFSALRAFALTKNWPLATLIFLLSMVPLGVNFAHFAFNSTGANFFTGCLTTDDVSSELAKQLTIASRTCLITADILLIYVTWFNMYRRTGPRHPTVQNRFLNVLLRDGTVYFVVLAILNILHLTLSLLSIEYSISNISFVTQFSEPITTILISRFLMHLQSANRRVLHLSSLDGTLAASSQTDTLVFERVVGSLGESLDAETYQYDVKSSITVDVDVVELGHNTEDNGGKGEEEAMEMTPVSPSSVGGGRFEPSTA